MRFVIVAIILLSFLFYSCRLTSTVAQNTAYSLSTPPSIDGRVKLTLNTKVKYDSTLSDTTSRRFVRKNSEVFLNDIDIYTNSASPMPDVGDGKLFLSNKSDILIEPSKVGDTLRLGIKIEFSDNSDAGSHYTDLSMGTYPNLRLSGNRYHLSYDKMTPYGIAAKRNNTYMKISVYDNKPNDKTKYPISNPLMVGYFRYTKRFIFIDKMDISSIISSPVLFRVSGNAGGFSLGSISPSLAMRLVQANINSENFTNINFSILLSITNYQSDPNSNTNYQYTLSSGGIFDLGGWVQIGPAYSFRDKKGYLVLGIKPSLFSNLFRNGGKN